MGHCRTGEKCESVRVELSSLISTQGGRLELTSFPFRCFFL